jgi:aminopeptidase N
MVAFNEVEEPWLDEGFTDYSAVRLAGELYGTGESAFDAGNMEVGYLDLRRMEYLSSPNVPMYGPAFEFGMLEYGVATYSKPVLSLLTLEGILGEDLMLEIMRTFFQSYKFQHPGTEEFRQIAEAVSGQNLAWFFDGLVYGEGVLNYAVTQVESNRVTVIREGDLQIPTEVLVKFQDGHSRLETWDGAEIEKSFEYPGEPGITSAEIDPERKILVDLRWSDNGLTRRANLPGWLAIVTRLIYQLQNGLMAWGGL